MVSKSWPAWLFLLLFMCSLEVSGQLPDTEIYIASLSKEAETWKFSEADNVTNRVGYDNQPHFSADGNTMFFVQVVDSIQSDVYSYSIEEKLSTRITSSPESEYSPNYTFDHSKLSVVRVDKDSAQRFYVFEPESPSNAVFIPGTDSIGYYCWLNDSLLAMFLVGEKFSLQILNTKTNQRHFIAYNIGRCLKLSSDKKALLFLDKSDSTQWMISSLQFPDYKTTPIVRAIDGNEDFCPLNDGSLLMGSAGKLFLWNEGSGDTWNLVKDYSTSIGPFYRITVNENATRIAFVAYAGKKP